MSAALRSPPPLRVVPGGGAPAAPAGAASPSDEALVEAVLRGEPEACTELYERLAPTIDATLYRILGGRGPELEDLVQSSFEQVWRTLVDDRFAHACSLRSWARSIATHLGLNAIRARQRERRVFDRDAEVDQRTGPDAERRTAARQQLDRVRAHLAAMPEDRAVTLVLHDVLGHDLAEIAVLTGVSVAAAQSRLVRGRKDFSTRLQGDDGGKR